jgi:hypothetical protein
MSGKREKAKRRDRTAGSQVASVTNAADLMVHPSVAAQYISDYVSLYRERYARFTAPAPAGAGYPAMPISPYLDSSSLVCHLATDGAVITDSSQSPQGQWEIAGGPALMVDTEPTRTPAWVTNLLKTHGLYGQHIGIYRLVAREPIRPEAWNGELPSPTAHARTRVDGTHIEVFAYAIGVTDLIERLTLGASGIVDLQLFDTTQPFWRPGIVRGLGFVTADRRNRRFYRHFEVLSHVAPAAWDSRGIWPRIDVDIRRDFVAAVGAQGSHCLGRPADGGPRVGRWYGPVVAGRRPGGRAMPAITRAGESSLLLSRGSPTPARALDLGGVGQQALDDVDGLPISPGTVGSWN